MREYEVEEAAALFKRLAGDRDHEGKAQAAAKLQTAVQHVIESVGGISAGGNFAAEVRPGTEGKVYVSRGNAIVCNLLFTEKGVYFWDQEKGAGDGRKLLPLEYHADVGQFVGTEEDPSRSPNPGGPKLYRNAVTVVIDEVCRVYRAMYASQR